MKINRILKIGFVLTFVIIYTYSVTGQTSLRKSVRLLGAKSTNVRIATIKYDKILVAGFNFFGDSSHYFSCLLDTNLNVIHYINHRELEPEIIAGAKTINFTDDGGYLINKHTLEDSVSNVFFKYAPDNTLEWISKIYYPNYKSATKIIETDSMYYIFGFQDTLDTRKQIYVDRISKKGEYLDSKVLFEKKAFIGFNDTLLREDGYVVSFSYYPFTGTELFTGIKTEIRFYDKNWNLMDYWRDRGSIDNIQINDIGEIYFSTRYLREPDNIPRLIVRKLSGDLEIEWTKDYLYPLFQFNPNLIGINNIVRAMWPDPRGGYYVMGDLVGAKDKFLDPPPLVPGGPLWRGVGLLKIDEDGNEVWHYKDGYELIFPEAAGQLSSGNIAIVGKGLIIDSDSLPRKTIVLIKVDKDGCFEPGCREDVATEEVPTEKPEVFPNPSDGIFYLKSIEKYNEAEMFIYNIDGKQIRHKIISKKDSNIDLTNFPPGMYNYRIMKKNLPIINGLLVKK